MNANERAAAEREYYHQNLEDRAAFREEAQEALQAGREELARLLARLSAERDSNDGERLWEAVPFDEWWNGVGPTERGREEYRKDADKVIDFMQRLI